MVPDKEIILVHAVIAQMGKALVVVAEAETLYAFASTLAQEIVLAVRARDVDVHPEVVAEYVGSRVNRFLDAFSRATVIQQGIDVGIVAAAKELAALAALGLSNVQAVNNESALRAPATPNTPKRSKIDRRKSILKVVDKPASEG